MSSLHIVRCQVNHAFLLAIGKTVSCFRPPPLLSPHTYPYLEYVLLKDHEYWLESHCGPRIVVIPGSWTRRKTYQVGVIKRHNKKTVYIGMAAWRWNQVRPLPPKYVMSQSKHRPHTLNLRTARYVRTNIEVILTSSF